MKKSGSWYSYNDTKLGQGRDASKNMLQDNPELAEEISALIMAEITGNKEELIDGNNADEILTPEA